MKHSVIQLFIHIFLVCTFLALPYIFAPTGFPGLTVLKSNAHERTNFASYLLMLAFFYANYYVLIPRFYFRQKYILYTFLILACFLTIAGFIYILDKQPGFHPPFSDVPSRTTRLKKPPGEFENSQTLFLFLVGLVVSFALKINDRLRRSEQERLHNELSYLKAQINPHFLFNTLNSIYSLALEKSERTADAVVMLSSLMRYVIREASENTVALDKEIAYIKNYVSLQKLRLDDTVIIDFYTDGDFVQGKIEPLILISFIENAFKYGVNPEQKSIIKIRITKIEKTLMLQVSNNKVRINRSEESSVGIGIQNTRARLQLLYPAKHQLTIHDNPESFVIDLKLTLS